MLFLWVAYVEDVCIQPSIGEKKIALRLLYVTYTVKDFLLHETEIPTQTGSSEKEYLFTQSLTI